MMTHGGRYVVTLNVCCVGRVGPEHVQRAYVALVGGWVTVFSPSPHVSILLTHELFFQYNFRLSFAEWQYNIPFKTLKPLGLW